VITANLLAEPLGTGRLRLADLAEVQRRRLWPIRFIQAAGIFGQLNALGQVLNPRGALPVPVWLARLFFGIPGIRICFRGSSESASGMSGSKVPPIRLAF
jgi:hypothetical protein